MEILRSVKHILLHWAMHKRKAKDMCVAIPGKVIALDGDMATVDFDGNRLPARAGLVPVNTGDRVLVHAGMIIQVLREEEADEISALFAELEAISNEDR